MTYPGGKNGSGVYQKIINLMPPHQFYIEPFLGGGAIMRLKRPAPIANLGIDIDAPALIRAAVLLEKIGPAIPGLSLRHLDAIDWLRNFESNRAIFYMGPLSLIYLDPPYLMSTRSSQRQLYRYEMSEAQHIELLDIILKLPCMVMISGYHSDLYANRLAQWRAVSFQAQTRGGTMATEWVWMNFPPPLELHDYRYLGSNFRERERIKKKQRRWKSRLERMPDLERYALLSVIADLATAETAGNDVVAGNIAAGDVVDRNAIIEEATR